MAYAGITAGAKEAEKNNMRNKNIDVSHNGQIELMAL